MICKLFFDGASKGNPGRAGAGAYIEIHDNHIELSKNVATATNNYAEYEGLILGLNYVIHYLIPQFGSFHLEINGDSKLVIHQILGKWKVKSSNLLALYNQTHGLLNQLNTNEISWSATHIKRELNSKADELANKALI